MIWIIMKRHPNLIKMMKRIKKNKVHQPEIQLSKIGNPLIVFLLKIKLLCNSSWQLSNQVLTMTSMTSTSSLLTTWLKPELRRNKVIMSLKLYLHRYRSWIKRRRAEINFRTQFLKNYMKALKSPMKKHSLNSSTFLDNKLKKTIIMSNKSKIKTKKMLLEWHFQITPLKSTLTKMNVMEWKTNFF